MSRTIFIAAAFAFAATLPAVPARAASRTFVSATGSDSNSCTITLPCQSLQAAYNAVAANGQIDALDPGNYRALTSPVRSASKVMGGLRCQHPPARQSSLTRRRPTRSKGMAGTTGIQLNSGGNLNVRDSAIRNFTNVGLSFSANNSSQLFVSHTLISGNGGGGITMGAFGSVTVEGSLNRVEIEDNALGLQINTEPGQTLDVTVSDTIIAKNGVGGFNSPGLICQSAGSPGGTAHVVVRESTIAIIIKVWNCWSGCTVSVTRSTIADNGIGLSLNGGQIVSYMDNNVINNGNGNNPSSTIGYQ